MNGSVTGGQLIFGSGTGGGRIGRLKGLRLCGFGSGCTRSEEDVVEGE